MGYRVKDTIELSLRINDQEYPLTEGNVLNFLHMASSSHFVLPTLHFSVIDVTRSMARMGLGDASKIQVILSCDGVVTARNYRVNTWLRPPGAETYVIDAFWDYPRYRVGTTNKSMAGSSTAVLAKIAETCGMKYDGVSTNDTQVWLPRNRTYGAFASYIAAHGFVTPKSHLVLAVDSQGVLRFHDVKAAKKSFLGTYGYTSSQAYQITDFQPAASAGLNNTLGGYRKTRVDTSVYSDAAVAHDTLEFTPDSPRLLMNREVRDVQGRGVFSYSPINFGNTHPNFQKALYQNSRYDSLANLSTEFIVGNPTLMEVCDQFEFTTDPQKPGEYDGSYVFSNKVIYIQGNTYMEKFVGLKEGML